MAAAAERRTEGGLPPSRRTQPCCCATSADCASWSLTEIGAKDMAVKLVHEKLRIELLSG